MNCFYALRKYGLAVAALWIMAVASMDALAADKKAKSVADWEIRGAERIEARPQAVMSNTAYALYNITNSKYLYCKYLGSSGIAKVLAWDDDPKQGTKPKPRFEFCRLPKEKKPSPLKFGDTVMIVMPDSIVRMGKAAPANLMYTKQEKGINLGLSEGGSMQWVIEGGSKGEPITTRAKISLYNIAAKDYVIYAEREHGINLRWNAEVNKPRDHRK